MRLYNQIFTDRQIHRARGNNDDSSSIVICNVSRSFHSHKWDLFKFLVHPRFHGRINKTQSKLKQLVTAAWRFTWCSRAANLSSCLLLGPPGSNWCFSFAPELVSYSAPRDLHRRDAYSICESWSLIHQDVYHDLFVCKRFTTRTEELTKCYEPLQKLRVRLWPCKTALSPPVILCN